MTLKNRFQTEPVPTKAIHCPTGSAVVKAKALMKNPLPRTILSLMSSLCLLVAVDATAAQQTNTNFYQELAWAPDGSRLSFSLNKGRDHEIYMIRVDGSNLTNATKN